MTRARRLRLVVDNMTLAKKVARQVARKFAPHLSIQDFEQAGYLGLCEAARRCTKVSTFERYAYFRIRGAIVDAHRRKAYREELNPSLEGIAAAVRERNRRSGAPHDPAQLAFELRDTCPLADELAGRSERARFLECAIASLPEDERYVIGQALDGVKVAAIAESRHRSATWTRAKLTAARQKVALAIATAGLAA